MMENKWNIHLCLPKNLASILIQFNAQKEAESKKWKLILSSVVALSCQTLVAPLEYKWFINSVKFKY